MRRGANVPIALAGLLLSTALAPSVHAMPPEGLRLIQGEIVLHPVRNAPAYSVITLRLRNDGELPIEGLRLLVSFGSRPLKNVAAQGARERVITLEPPLGPGEEREIEITERRTELHVAVTVAEVFPALQVLIDGAPAALDPPAFIWEGRLYGPIGDLARGLGWDVEWSEQWLSAAINSDAHTVLLQVGSGYAAADGVLADLQTGVRQSGGKIIAPLRPVLEALGATVAYDAARNTTQVTAPTPEPRPDGPNTE